MAVHLVDHFLVFVADVVCNVFLRDIKEDHPGHNVVAQVMKTEMTDLSSFKNLGEALADDIGSQISDAAV